MKVLATVQLNALRAVEAVARLGSLRAAAGELSVTPGAVSQQVLKAEDQLGGPLFRRTRQGLTPTATGRDVAAHLTDGFLALSRGVAAARDTSETTMTISVAPILAAKWLVWRLADFHSAHPGLRVRIDADVRLMTPGAGDIDACLRVARQVDEPALTATHLLDQHVFPVCAPALAEGLHDVTDLARIPVIQDRYARFGWDIWLTPNGAPNDLLCDGPVYSDASLCLDAAIAGQGLFLAWEPLATDALAAGRVVPALPGRFPTGDSYWFVAPGGRLRPPVAAFRDWVSAQLTSGSTPCSATASAP